MQDSVVEISVLHDRNDKVDFTLLWDSEAS